MKPKKIYIIGPIGSGKSTLSEVLSKKLKIKRYSLDDIRFKRKFNIIRDEKDILKKINDILIKNKWIIEGAQANQPWVATIAKQAEAVIWLDKPTHVLAWRIIKRTLTTKRARDGVSRLTHTAKLLYWLTKYRKHSMPSHKRVIETHKNGYQLKTNKQIEAFVDSL